MDPANEPTSKQTKLKKSYDFNHSYHRVAAIVADLEKKFADQHGRAIDLQNPKDFSRLAELANFYEIFTANKKEGVIAKRYDVAQVFIANYLGRSADVFPNLSDPDKQLTIEGIFGRMFDNFHTSYYLYKADLLTTQEEKGNREKIDSNLLLVLDEICKIRMASFRCPRDILTSHFGDAFSNTTLFNDYYVYNLQNDSGDVVYGEDLQPIKLDSPRALRLDELIFKYRDYADRLSSNYEESLPFIRPDS